MPRTCLTCKGFAEFFQSPLAELIRFSRGTMDSEFLFVALTVVFKTFFSQSHNKSKLPNYHRDDSGIRRTPTLQFFCSSVLPADTCRKAKCLVFPSGCHYTIFLPGCVFVIIAGIVRMARNAMDDLLGCGVTV